MFASNVPSSVENNKQNAESIDKSIPSDLSAVVPLAEDQEIKPMPSDLSAVVPSAEVQEIKPIPSVLSDVVLLVEDEEIKAHRCILAMWSPVFEKMFTAEFTEKNSQEVPLPGKKADEIKEMLLVIYPTTANAISEENCYFLIRLADEYQMEKVTEKCENYLLGTMKEFSARSLHEKVNQKHIRCIDLLILSQGYCNLTKLRNYTALKKQLNWI